MNKKVKRNEPCPCGSGKKYKNCCLGKQDTARKTYTPLGKRKFKATVIASGSKSSQVFQNLPSATTTPIDPQRLKKLKFEMAKEDFQVKKEEIEPLPSLEKAPKPSETQEEKLSLKEEFMPTEEDYRVEK